MPTLPQSPLPLRADFDVPIPTHLIPAVNLLIELDYSVESIEAIRSHLARFGTAECCFAIDSEHRAMVEAELDRDPAWNRSEWDEVRYATT